MRVSVAQRLKQQKRGRPKKDNDVKNTITFDTFKRARHGTQGIGQVDYVVIWNFLNMFFQREM